MGAVQKRPRRLRRLAGRAALVLLLLAAGGFAAETIARTGDATGHAPPGRLVDVGGHRLHLHCVGTGGPTVVFEAGWGESAANWADIQASVAAGIGGRSMRACAYDRAGYAWSEPGPGPRDAARAADELRVLLERSGERGPFVFAAHSYGGHVVRLFAHRHPERVAGLVLVDVSDASGHADGPGRVAVPLMVAQTTVYQFAARVGLVRLAGAAMTPDGSPDLARRHAAVVYGSGSMSAARDEALAFPTSTEQVRAAERPGAWSRLPVTVISPAGGDPLGTHRDLAGRSAQGRHVLAGTGDHYVHLREPHLVAEAIAAVA
ncbi:alpha/beta hydrolase [Nonomuraea sp. NPDC050310]|uniref:alpha/beta fold hydrolase n=1 Tax=Nonomuraea sp. NPDC050310 TaxID=3154935 RepID=UPI0033E67E08